MKSLIKGGFFDHAGINFKGNTISPIEFSSAILFNQWKLQDEEEEFTIMKIKIEGTEKEAGKQQLKSAKRIVYDLYDEYDKKTKISSMARATGYTCTAAMNLLMNNLVTKKGVLPPELIGKDEKCFNFILSYLADRGVIYKKSEFKV
jgi:saccharopine dehydrogenase-like NADP-dependent oxidoreductase